MKKKVLGIVGGALLLTGMVLIICFYPHLTEIKKDFDRLKTEEYDTLVMSMYPIDYYKESDYMHYRGMAAVQMSYTIPNDNILCWYLSRAKKSGNYVERVYMGIDPEHVNQKNVVKMIQDNPDIFFEITISYPQIDYWTQMGEKKFEKVMNTYRATQEALLALENADLYSFGTEEWLIANKKNFEDEMNTNEDVSEFLMCNMDVLHPYGISYENLDGKFADYRYLYEKYCNLEAYPDASGMEIIFFGDSIIGNYTDSLSVPEVVSALTGAEVFNLGFGGRSAALYDTTEIAFSQVVDAFLKNDLSFLPVESQVYAGVKDYSENGHQEAKKMFVVNYGLNDYFNGAPLKSEDEYDICSYAGSIRSAVKKLQEAYPEAQVLLLTPHFSREYNFGRDIRGERGGNMEDYANVVIDLAKELNVDVLDNFHEFPVTEFNWREYQPDGTHLNEKGRFLLGETIARRIKECK